jgi:Protein of unknown function (DUF2958)
MKLLTKKDLKALPKIGSQEGNLNPLCKVKLFAPWGMWTWYLIEYDPETRMALALAQGFDDEVGYVSLDELEQIRGPLGLRIERDRVFKPVPLSELKK